MVSQHRGDRMKVEIVFEHDGTFDMDVSHLSEKERKILVQVLRDAAEILGAKDHGT